MSPGELRMSLLAQLGQRRPDLLAAARQALAFAQAQTVAQRMSAADVEDLTAWVMLHEIGKLLTAPAAQPLRKSSCDLSPKLLAHEPLKRWKDVGLQPDHSLSLEGAMIIAQAELAVMPGRKDTMSRRTRTLYMQREYGPGHEQLARYDAWSQLADGDIAAFHTLCTHDLAPIAPGLTSSVSV